MNSREPSDFQILRRANRCDADVGNDGWAPTYDAHRQAASPHQLRKVHSEAHWLLFANLAPWTRSIVVIPGTDNCVFPVPGFELRHRVAGAGCTQRHAFSGEIRDPDNRPVLLGAQSVLFD